MKKIVVVAGATASGKTQKAVDFCKENNGEIISCDSRQVYKYLDVGTNKEGILIDDGIRSIDGINQYLTDIIEPNEVFNAADFVCEADKKIGKILEKGKIPVVVGGTGLYLKTLLYGIDIMPPADEKLRESLSEKTSEELYETLLSLDRSAAEKNKKNPQRLIRAIEVNLLTQKTMKEAFKPKKTRYNFKYYYLETDRKILYEKINLRCKKMLEDGMIEETKRVLKMGFKNCPAFSGIGYRDVIKFLNKEVTKEFLLLNFSKETRHYAKRQITWFKTQMSKNE
jgi:tRNA dimethylallyltransferase